MNIEHISTAIINNDLDKLIEYSKLIKDEELDVAIEIYENYLNKRVDITAFIHRTIFSIKNRREKNKIAEEGFFICKFK